MLPYSPNRIQKASGQRVADFICARTAVRFAANRIRQGVMTLRFSLIWINSGRHFNLFYARLGKNMCPCLDGWLPQRRPGGSF